MKKLLYILIISITLLTACGVEEAEDTTNLTSESTVETTEEKAIEEPVSKEATTEVEKNSVSEQEETSEDSGLVPVQLVRAIDGDTIKVIIDGKEENVRFLLVDTPETNHPRHGEQPFGQEAKKFTTDMVESGQVQLEFDVSHRDKYQRLLAYVYVDGVSVQEELLKNGLARVAYVYAPNTKYVDKYRAIQEDAQKKAVGIWSVENYATDRGFDTSVIETPEEKEEVSNTNGCDIKGNINSRGEKIYHMPGQQFYDVTDPEEMFCSEEEAVEAGFRKSKR